MTTNNRTKNPPMPAAMPSRSLFQPLSRRDFVRRSFAAAAALGLPLSHVSGDDQKLLEEFRKLSDSERIAKLKSHSPGNILRDSETFIIKTCMPRPKARRINEQICVSSQLENVFLVDFGEHAVLLDSGFDHQVHHHLDNFEALGCDLSKVVAILASHSHVDHTGGLKKARKRLDVPVVAHPLAKKPITTGDLLQTAAVIPEVKGWEFDYPACPIDEMVDHGDVIQVGDEKIKVVHIPGHTPDSLAYLWNGHFFTGDTVFGAGLIGWAHARWFSNYTDHAETMLYLIRSKPRADMFYCTHGPDLPWSPRIPDACLKTLGPLIARKEDPCNSTPRTLRRPDDAPTRTLRLPA